MNLGQEKNYPIPMWKPDMPINQDIKKGELNPAYAHNKKQEQALELEGYTTESRHLKYEYPKSLYDANGNNIPALDKAHEAELLAAGYSLTVIPKKVRSAQDPRTTGIASPSDGRVDELESKIEELNQTIDDLKADGVKTQQSLAEILEAVTTGTGKKGK